MQDAFTRLLLASAAVALFLIGGTATAQSTPVLQFRETTFDFGEIEEGDVAEHVFTFTNAGDVAVSVARVRPSCGCTTPEWTADPVAPGAEGRIAARFSSFGRPGPFRKAIAVETTGSTFPVMLYIEGDVVPPTIDPTTAVRMGSFAFETDRIDFGAPSPGETLSHTFLVLNDGARPVRIQDARTSSHSVSVSFPSTPVFPGEVARIQVTLRNGSAAAPVGEHTVVLVTNDGEQPEKLLRVVGGTEAAVPQQR